MKIVLVVGMFFILGPITLMAIGFLRVVVAEIQKWLGERDRRLYYHSADLAVDDRDFHIADPKRRGALLSRKRIELTIDPFRSKNRNYERLLAIFEEQVPGYDLYDREVFNREFEQAWMQAVEMQFEADLEDLEPSDFR